jgi:hypothetical protein
MHPTNGGPDDAAAIAAVQDRPLPGFGDRVFENPRNAQPTRDG